MYNDHARFISTGLETVMESSDFAKVLNKRAVFNIHYFVFASFFNVLFVSECNHKRGRGGVGGERETETEKRRRERILNSAEPDMGLFS